MEGRKGKNKRGLKSVLNWAMCFSLVLDRELTMIDLPRNKRCWRVLVLNEGDGLMQHGPNRKVDRWREEKRQTE